MASVLKVPKFRPVKSVPTWSCQANRHKEKGIGNRGAVVGDLRLRLRGQKNRADHLQKNFYPPTHGFFF